MENNVIDMKNYIKENKEAIDDTNKLIDSFKEAEKKENNINVTTDNSEDSATEKTLMNVLIDPETGEHKIIGRAEESNLNFDFNGIINQINSGDPDILSTKPFSEIEIIDYLKKSDDETLLKSLSPEGNISPDSLRSILDIVNKKLNREDINIYREAPDEFKKLVDEYIGASKGQIRIIGSKSLNSARNMISENLISEFISNIRQNRAKTDFAKELETIYSSIPHSIIEGKDNSDITQMYKNAAANITDEGKRDRFLLILSRIEEAENLTELQKFCKTCKIKKIEIEKADSRVYTDFLSKYRESVNNIYDISLACKVLNRFMSKEYGCSLSESIAFFVAFCKQCKSYSCENVLEHAYMYYVLYNAVMLDSTINTKFKENVYKCITNLKARNSSIF